MKQGEIWYANLNPTTGREQAGFRPVVVLSGNLFNTHVPLVICCPLTTKLKRYHGNVILSPSEINGLQEESEILTFHIRSLSTNRLKSRIGCITQEELLKIKQCLKDILQY